MGDVEQVREVQQKLTQSGEKERLKALLRDRLIECGWRDELKARCRAIVQRRGPENVTVQDIVSEITPVGRSKVPDTVKAELLSEIRELLLSE
mmetsp:Transcript_14204/g.33615  ORF Transcript_14204/g.33615 Transcript_14204/m.33615 type:complete len:93 (+) Transcript_14204:121-399(+)